MSGIPWQLVLKHSPSLIDAASRLLSVSLPRSAEISGAKDLNSLRDQVAVLAKDQQAHADVMKQIADQLAAVASGAQVAAARARLALIVGGVGAVLGLAACALALLR